jgi:catechol 2,3-dioxygenase-like lactoylglutathione lyase family enzyme
VTRELSVADVRETQAYYRDGLGFKVAWIYPENFGAVYYGTTEVLFSQEAGKNRPCWNLVRVEGADATLATYRERGAKIIEEIASQPWGMRAFTIEGNNGHRFRIGPAEGPVVDPAGSAS